MLLSCGDALIDFLPERLSDGREALLPVIGGSCLNIAVGMARLGVSTGFVGGIATDFLGQMIADHALKSNVSLRFATRSARQTTLAFVQMQEGEPQYAFYDEETASRCWTYNKGVIPFSEIDALHIGSTTLIADVTAWETEALLTDAEDYVTVSFDPNCRAGLITDKEKYKRRMEAFAARAHIVRMSDVDFRYLYGHENFTEKATEWLEKRACLVVITRGGQAVKAWHKIIGSLEISVPHIVMVDTVGAGDSFQSALLAGLKLTGRIGKEVLCGMEENELGKILEFAANCAAITCSRAGANPPYRDELDASVWDMLGLMNRQI